MNLDQVLNEFIIYSFMLKAQDRFVTLVRTLYHLDLKIQ